MNYSLQEDIRSIIEQVGVPLNDLEGKTVLISGACGFLGSWFTAIFEYLNKYHFKIPVRVIAIDSFIATDSENLLKKIKDPNIEFVKANISNRLNLMDIRSGGDIDYIIHAAGIASPVYYRKFPIETIDGMVLGLKWLLEFATMHPVTSFLYFSSSEMYGNPHPSEVPTKETYNGNVSAIGPRACYDEAKRLGETYASVYHRIHSIPIKWVRPFNVSGPGMRPKDDRVLPKFIYAGLQNQPLTVHLPGLQTRTLCYITDAMVGFLKTLLIGKNGEVYNIGRDLEEVTVVGLAEKVSEAFNGKLKINRIEPPTEYPQDQALRRCPNIDKAREQLGFSPKIDLKTIIQKTLEWGKTVK